MISTFLFANERRERERERERKIEGGRTHDTRPSCFCIFNPVHSAPFLCAKVFVLCHTRRLSALKMMNTLGMIPLVIKSS